MEVDDYHCIVLAIMILQISAKCNFCTIHIQRQYLLGMNMEIHHLTMHAQIGINKQFLQTQLVYAR